ncbi:sodium/glutamate symporter [Roseibium sp. RKSG952]|uniref:sodium/glutamate symporter n=1 Tax=Roseibium sp. RKSG952 TaxID=2529384 RepID=UPI0012BCF2D2|nr:sodium/glutamate symporter [Roseibium sp. RKSG952]MTH96886.1 sodium/glutamate symporter [Roseibium sp. RKSG952]
MPPIEVGAIETFTLGILVYFVGHYISERFPVLHKYSIPEPVTGGLLASLLALAIVMITGRKIVFDMAARDLLIIYFFTTVGLNARISDLLKGGPLLGFLLLVTAFCMLMQDGIGLLLTKIWHLPSELGVMLGTAPFVGGHGTVAAWGPILTNGHGVQGATEIGMAVATLGLISASLIGGPIARYLIEKNGLVAESNGHEVAKGAELDVPTAHDPITNHSLLQSILWIHAAMAIGYVTYKGLQNAGINLPLFVPCMMAGILLSNTLPRLFKNLSWPSQTPSMALVSEFSLSVFLAISLMTMQLWALTSSVGLLAVTILIQTLLTTVFIIYILFPLMGRNYFAAVLSAGFAGFALGATPTAIANMNAVEQHYGPSPLAFVILPLVSAFFVDIINVIMIQVFVGL